VSCFIINIIERKPVTLPWTGSMLSKETRIETGFFRTNVQVVEETEKLNKVIEERIINPPGPG